ncbi:hypothetical protein B0J17DRAFT_714247 [Rhizoctonia solani]|nr:hypothetical protein B0J17DRAFT_714247 [Rhizoctonia solani]
MFNYIAALALFVSPAIAVPWTNATCVNHAWSFNSRGQSPCWVAASVASPCTTDNSFKIPALETGKHYTFDSAQANACVSVMWNLLSACAVCQSGGVSTSWKEWRQACTDNMVTIGRYPIPLPAGIAVPSWAYYDFTLADAFNTVIASQQSGLESSAIPGATSTAASTSTSSEASTATGANGSTSTPNPVKSQSGSSSNTGAIVGGVVGGVLGIGLIGLIAFIIARRRKPEDPAIKHPEANRELPKTTPFNAASPIAGHVPLYQFGAPNQPVSTPEYKPYDPSNPSTFPTGPTTPTTGHHVEPLSYPFRSQGIPGQPPYPNSTQF